MSTRNKLKKIIIKLGKVVTRKPVSNKVNLTFKSKKDYNRKRDKQNLKKGLKNE